MEMSVFRIWHESTEVYYLTGEWPNKKMKHFNFWITVQRVDCGCALSLPLCTSAFTAQVYFIRRHDYFLDWMEIKKKTFSLSSRENKHHHDDACDGDRLLSIFPRWISSRCNEQGEAITSHFKATGSPRRSSAVLIWLNGSCWQYSESCWSRSTNCWGHDSC